MPSASWVDVDAFEERLGEAQRARGAGRVEEAVRHLSGALRLYEGDLLEDAPYADWCALHRESLRRMYIDGVLHLAGVLEGGGQFDEASRHYTLALQRDGLREETHRGLMRCYAKTGQRDLAIRQYRAFAAALMDDLDVAPSRETEALFQAIAQGTPIPQASFL